MLISTLRWRKYFDVDGAMKEEFPEEVFGQLGRTYGKDKEGHPISYVHYLQRSLILTRVAKL
jgi:hypothetical protein